MSEAPAALHARRRADLPLPAALRLLLEPARLRAPRRRARHRGLAARLPRGRGARRRAAQPHRRRAAACATTSRRSSRRRARLDLYTNLITSGIPLHARAAGAASRRAGSTTCRCRSRTSRAPASDRIAGLRVVRAQAGGRALGEGAGPAAHAQRRAPPREPRPGRPRSSRWPSRSAPIGSSWPTRSTSAGRSSNRARAPAHARAARARARASRARRAARLRGRMEVLFVTPDYYAEFPKACMDGWGRRFIVIAPDGLVLPCHAAHTLPGLAFDNVQDRLARRDLARLGRRSTRSAARRGCPSPAGAATGATVDFGGCRCQAFHLTGNAAATDPVCSLSPDHGLIETARAEALAPGRRRARVPERAIAGAGVKQRRVDASTLDPPRAGRRRGGRRARARRRACRSAAVAASSRLLGGVWIDLALGFLLAGLIEVLIPPQMLTRWLGGERHGAGHPDRVGGGPRPARRALRLLSRRGEPLQERRRAGPAHHAPHRQDAGEPDPHADLRGAAARLAAHARALHPRRCSCRRSSGCSGSGSSCFSRDASRRGGVDQLAGLRGHVVGLAAQVAQGPREGTKAIHQGRPLVNQRQVLAAHDAEPAAQGRGRLERLRADLDAEAAAAWTSSSRSCWGSARGDPSGARELAPVTSQLLLDSLGQEDLEK